MIRAHLSFSRAVLLAAIFPAFLAPSLRAADPSGGAVSGVVVAADGGAVQAASIVLRDPQTGLHRYGTATGEAGTFELSDVGAGAYELIVSHVAYATHESDLRVDDGVPTVVRIVLRATTVPQGEVVVTGARARRRIHPITFSNLTARDLEMQPAMKDMPVLLSSLPSVTYYTENGNGIGYSTLRMRGFDQRRIAVSINGIPQNDPEDLNVFWINFFDIQGATQDVQVQRGAGSSRYGPTAIGGAINIAAFPYRAEPYAFAELGYGTFDTRRASVEANTGLLNDRYVLFGRFSRLLTDGYRDWSWSEFYRFFVGGVRYGARSTLTLQAYGGPQYDALAFSGIPKSANESNITDAFGTEIDRRYNFSASSRDVERFHQPHVELFHDWNATENLSIHQALFWVKGEGYFDFGGTFRSPDYLRLPDGWRNLAPEERALPLFLSAPDVSALLRAYLDQWQVGWLPRAKWRSAAGESMIGGEARIHRSVRWGRTQEAVGLPDELVGSDADYRVYQFHGEKLITSLYASHLARPHDRWAVQGDLQLTYRRYRHGDELFYQRAFSVPYVFANPRIGITLNPERPVSAYASVAYATREPRLKSLYDGEEAGAGFVPQFETDASGRPDYDAPLVTPEHLFDLEVGASYTQLRYRVAANVYFIGFQNEIVPSGGLDQFGVPRTGNADRTRHLGMELEGAVRLLPGLDLSGNATFSRNRFISFSEFAILSDGTVRELDRGGNPIAGFPEQVINASVQYSRHGWQSVLRLKFAGEQFIDNSGATTVDGRPDPDLKVNPYLLLNAGLRYAYPNSGPLSALELALDVNNVLNNHVLMFGNVGPAGPQFFPLATRNVFASVRYTIQ